ncbi:shikimate dehydrogenase [Serinicoccus profundi]|uniref:shikimate dehydrogenase n=1 Tax=Serinicoccus profundi TaxID=1078471 RepID=UPI000255EC9E|nr:shikimate dehydrogenase [Serinicoccus profundi]
MLTRAAVVGSPVAHSLSPVLHRAAYTALGLTDWCYDRVEVPQGALAAHVAALGPEWVGLSVTMPGKEEALDLADDTGPAARAVGAANTLVRRETGWYADNTDVHGLQAALTEAGVGTVSRAVVVGAGATARSAILALHTLGAQEVTLCVRDWTRPATDALLERLGMRVHRRALSEGIPLDTEVVLSTLPGGVPAPPVLPAGAQPPVVMDVSYAPWPSALADVVATATHDRVRVVRGTRMLLHQAVRQVELMTGLDAPTRAMDAALRGALDDRAGS